MSDQGFFGVALNPGPMSSHAHSTAARTGGAPAQRPTGVAEARAEVDAVCDRCERDLGERDFVRRTAAGTWRHESCPPTSSAVT
jgi:ribosomal protein L37AE/L43A